MSTYPFVCFLCHLVKTSLLDYYSNYRKERGELKTALTRRKGKKMVIHKLLEKFKQTEIKTRATLFGFSPNLAPTLPASRSFPAGNKGNMQLHPRGLIVFTAAAIGKREDPGDETEKEGNVSRSRPFLFKKLNFIKEQK